MSLFIHRKCCAAVRAGKTVLLISGFRCYVLFIAKVYGVIEPHRAVKSVNGLGKAGQEEECLKMQLKP